MKVRDYAISLGLAKKGSRGRLSQDAKRAIEQAVADGKRFTDYPVGGYGISSSNSDFDQSSCARLGGINHSSATDGNSNPEIGIKNFPATHDYSTVYGIDTKLRRPVVIAFQWCAKCLLQIKYCMHDIPQLPEYMGGGDAFIAWPTAEQITEAMELANVG